MKKVIGGILLLVFLFDLIGYYPLFLIKQSYIRANIENLVKEDYDDLLILTFDLQQQSELTWHKDDEFSWNGNMYDIVRVSHKDENSVSYLCIADHHENKLIKNLSGKVEKNAAQNNQVPPSTLVLLIISEECQVFHSSAPSLNLLGINNTPYINNYLSFSPEVHCLPPQES